MLHQYLITVANNSSVNCQKILRKRVSVSLLRITCTMDYSRFTFRDVNIHAKGVVDLHWNADGTMLGTVAADKTVKVGQTSLEL